ncbi:hypothetical protein C1H76_1405 [Elsinoe australis]|uniref:Uncharacterized protein n=1 Tax=Elsinoe australis TaxID=40998 RepID=A0A4V6DV05_9PEZI|nr:hypothetical protein C1H76_1405 [Elsinoe australis]
MKFAAPFFIAAGLLANLAIAQSGKTPYVPGRGSSGSNGNGNGQGYTPYSQWNSPAGSRASGSSSLPSYESRPPYSPPATDPGYDLTLPRVSRPAIARTILALSSATSFVAAGPNKLQLRLRLDNLASRRQIRNARMKQLGLATETKLVHSFNAAWTGSGEGADQEDQVELRGDREGAVEDRN